MTYLVLDNIRSIYNTASIFRTADGAGVEKIYLCGTTPSPVDRFGRERGDFAKVSLGAETSILWEYCQNTLETVKKLKGEGLKVISVERHPKAQNFKESGLSSLDKVVYVFGNEVEGISEEVLSLSDKVVEIPMKGKKESLNVSVAVGIILFYQAL